MTGVLRRLPSARSVIIGCMVLQGLVALSVFSDDIYKQILWSTGGGFESVPVSPVSPGDQTRRYVPRQVPRHPDTPGGLPPGVNLPRDLPRSLTFRISDTEEYGPMIVATGGVDENAYARFVAFQKDNPEAPKLLALHSPGGSVDAALRIGQSLRENGFNTIILPDAACMSSCPYILGGGVERAVSRSGWVGLHQHYYDENIVMPMFMAVEGIQQGQAATMEYLGRMGIDPMIMVNALKTPPADIYLMVEDELTTFGLATTIID